MGGVSSPRANKSAAARHRVRRRRRLGILGASVAVTFVVGSASVVVLPQLRSIPAPATSGATTLEQASLEALSRPVSAVMAAQDAAADDLKKRAQRIARIRESVALPAGSGEGRRIVFSETAQRVWLVADDGNVERTYLVSGSKFDNLNPGTYSVQSKTRHATAFDYSGSMEYFVRFTSGFTAPIGFHTVPVDNAGRPEQTRKELGTPTSAGCVRQWRDDAIALWTFAPIGTKVVVTA
jgi:lipoprotein-anchoring transpeptidase ErfK/SrfK